MTPLYTFQEDCPHTVKHTVDRPYLFDYAFSSNREALLGVINSLETDEVSQRALGLDYQGDSSINSFAPFVRKYLTDNSGSKDMDDKLIPIIFNLLDNRTTCFFTSPYIGNIALENTDLDEIERPFFTYVYIHHYGFFKITGNLPYTEGSTTNEAETLRDKLLKTINSIPDTIKQGSEAEEYIDYSVPFEHFDTCYSILRVKAKEFEDHLKQISPISPIS